MLHFLKKRGGFTLIELIVAMGIISILMGFVTLNLLNSRNKASLESTIDMIITDIKSQQTNAMLGKTQGGNQQEYGIHINSDSYVLFTGNTYNPAASSNFEIRPEESVLISTTFPDGNIIFLRGSGEIQGFVNTQNTIQITHTGNGGSKTIRFNKLGSIESVE